MPIKTDICCCLCWYLYKKATAIGCWNPTAWQQSLATNLKSFVTADCWPINGLDWIGLTGRWCSFLRAHSKLLAGFRSNFRTRLTKPTRPTRPTRPTGPISPTRPRRPTRLTRVSDILWISWAYHGHILGISWAYLGHILGYLGYILGIYWAYLGHILSTSWAYLGHILGISRVYLRHILGISRAYLGFRWYILDRSWA